MANHLHDKQAADGGATVTRCPDAIAAVGAELLAWSDAMDRARSLGLALGRAEAAAARRLAAEAAERARDEGYAAAVADMKAAAVGIVRVWGELADAERGRWVVRGEVRTRATFGDPHPDDYPGRGKPRPTLRRVS